jgi:hypothetical protein
VGWMWLRPLTSGNVTTTDVSSPPDIHHHLFFLSRKARNFFPGDMTKTLNQIFLFSSTRIGIFFSWKILENIHRYKVCQWFVAVRVFLCAHRFPPPIKLTPTI